MADIAARYANDVLIFLGDGEVFVDPIVGGLRPWTEDLKSWRRIVLLTPVPRRRWSWRERRIAEGGIAVLPATPAGVAVLGEFLRSDSQPPRLAFERTPVRAGLLAREGRQALRWHTDALPTETEREATVDAIAQELPAEALELLSVMALFPEIRSDLTLHLGATLKDAKGGLLLEEERFGALSVLPWLRYGRMPDWLRLDLAQTLSPAREAEAREVLKNWISTASDDAARSPLGVVTPGSSRSGTGRPGTGGNAVIRDAIFLHLQRGESLATLDLRAPDDLERLAQPQRWSHMTIALLMTIALSLTVLVSAFAFWDRVKGAYLASSWSDMLVALAAVVALAGTLAGLHGLLSGSVRWRRWSASFAFLCCGLAALFVAPKWWHFNPKSYELPILLGFLLPCFALGFVREQPVEEPFAGFAAIRRKTGQLPVFVLGAIGLLLALPEPFPDQLTSSRVPYGLVIYAAALAAFHAHEQPVSFLRLFSGTVIAGAGGITLLITSGLVLGGLNALGIAVGPDSKNLISAVGASLLLMPIGCAVMLHRSGLAGIRPVLGLCSAASILAVLLAGFEAKAATPFVIVALLPPLLLLLPFALYKPLALRRVLPWVVGAILSGASVVVGITVSRWWTGLTASPSVPQSVASFSSSGIGIGIGLLAALCLLLPAASAVVRYEFGVRLQRVYQPSAESLVILTLWLLGVRRDFTALSSLDLSWFYLPAALWIASYFGHRGRWLLLWGGAPLLFLSESTFPGTTFRVWTDPDVGLYLASFVVFQLAVDPATRTWLSRLRQFNLSEIVALLLVTTITLWVRLETDIGFGWDLSTFQDLAALLLGAVGATFWPVMVGGFIAFVLSAVFLMVQSGMSADWFSLSLGSFPLQSLLTPICMFWLARWWATSRASKSLSGFVATGAAYIPLIVSLLLFLTSSVRDSVLIAAFASYSSQVSLLHHGRLDKKNTLPLMIQPLSRLLILGLVPVVFEISWGRVSPEWFMTLLTLRSVRITQIDGLPIGLTAGMISAALLGWMIGTMTWRNPGICASLFPPCARMLRLFERGRATQREVPSAPEMMRTQVLSEAEERLPSEEQPKVLGEALNTSLEDGTLTPPAPPLIDTQVIILVHGIRDYALWQKSIRRTFERHFAVVETTNYGLFDLVRFLLPISYFRRAAIEVVWRQLRDIKRQHPERQLSFVAHGFGSYVLAHILQQEFDFTAFRILFCKSVLK
jgi:hypothetical protein